METLWIVRWDEWTLGLKIEWTWGGYLALSVLCLTVVFQRKED